MEIAIAEWVGTRTHLVVPNVSYGMYVHECDLFVLSKSGYATEIEIKISVSDLRADAKKWHAHRSRRIKFLYFAVPEQMRKCMGEIPENAGVIVVSDGGHCELLRKPTANKLALKLSADDQFQLARLGALRIWGLKRELVRLRGHSATPKVIDRGDV